MTKRITITIDDRTFEKIQEFRKQNKAKGIKEFNLSGRINELLQGELVLED